MFDVIIVGGGPAGLSGALILGRCRRRVLLCDSGDPRNSVSHAVNGFLTRDGVQPHELRRLAREELAAYPNVQVMAAEVVEAARKGDDFEIALADGTRHAGRKLLLATGLAEDLPDIPGFREFWGSGVYNCPYCDGWENRDRPMAVYGREDTGVGLTLEMLIWSRDVILLTDGTDAIPHEKRRRLDANGIRVDTRAIDRLEGDESGLRRIVFHDGEPLDRSALFYVYGARQASPLIEQLGCCAADNGTVRTQSYERTEVPGLYVAGDASRRVQFAIVAAAEGAMAAFAINTELYKEDTA